jgi:hypothetical protein
VAVSTCSSYIIQFHVLQKILQLSKQSDFQYFLAVLLPVAAKQSVQMIGMLKHIVSVCVDLVDMVLHNEN